MLTAEYLRRQADTCLLIARHCFDLAAAERLRLIATELKAKAADMDRDDARAAPMAHTGPCH